MTQTVLKDGDREIAFTGDLIATASSEELGKERWSDMCIYLTNDKRYVVHGVGRSSIPGEEQRSWVKVCGTAVAVVTVLTRTAKDVSYMPNLNQLLLQRASILDDALHDASSRHVI